MVTISRMMRLSANAPGSALNDAVLGAFADPSQYFIGAANDGAGVIAAGALNLTGPVLNELRSVYPNSVPVAFTPTPGFFTAGLAPGVAFFNNDGTPARAVLRSVSIHVGFEANWGGGPRNGSDVTFPISVQAGSRDYATEAGLQPSDVPGVATIAGRPCRCFLVASRSGKLSLSEGTVGLLQQGLADNYPLILSSPTMGTRYPFSEFYQLIIPSSIASRSSCAGVTVNAMNALSRLYQATFATGDFSGLIDMSVAVSVNITMEFEPPLGFASSASASGPLTDGWVSINLQRLPSQTYIDGASVDTVMNVGPTSLGLIDPIGVIIPYSSLFEGFNPRQEPLSGASFVIGAQPIADLPTGLLSLQGEARVAASLGELSSTVLI